ncbi:hypothetical protein GCK72_006822 [Caenorhabditis remanei]|uniref:Uncharacterized protein n=1 Tax=Caenorhabditis remanei TaxID=31234 RepID=A0A6A5HJT9_CAERE|nr:hypothetical protein GCK72_006822 [Caenorhabditis remanei]KAF1766864.1 hypothetical protein GCK72_006822 [Caenorhabditis remanei]
MRYFLENYKKETEELNISFEKEYDDGVRELLETERTLHSYKGGDSIKKGSKRDHFKKDPRTTKRCAKAFKGSFWVFGGYDIELADGRIATLQWHKFTRSNENSTIPLRWIQKYEDVNYVEDNVDPDALENRIIEPENDGEEERDHHWSYLKTLSIFVW